MVSIKRVIFLYVMGIASLPSLLHGARMDEYDQKKAEILDSIPLNISSFKHALGSFKSFGRDIEPSFLIAARKQRKGEIYESLFLAALQQKNLGAATLIMAADIQEHYPATTKIWHKELEASQDDDVCVDEINITLGGLRDIYIKSMLSRYLFGESYKKKYMNIRELIDVLNVIALLKYKRTIRIHIIMMIFSR